MFGMATAGERLKRRTAGRRHLRDAAIADLGFAVLGGPVAAHIRLSNQVTQGYLALPVLWIAAPWLARAYDVRFAGTGPGEYRKLLGPAAPMRGYDRRSPLFTQRRAARTASSSESASSGSRSWSSSGAGRSCWPAGTPAACRSSSVTIRRSPRCEHIRGAGRSMSSRSCSTCSSATFRWPDSALFFPARPTVRGACLLPPGGQAGPWPPAASQRAMGAVLRGVGAARSAVRRELVVRPSTCGLCGRPSQHGSEVRCVLTIPADNTVLRTPSQIQDDCLPETDNCALPTHVPQSHEDAVGSRLPRREDGYEDVRAQS